MTPNPEEPFAVVAAPVRSAIPIIQTISEVGNQNSLDRRLQASIMEQTRGILRFQTVVRIRKIGTDSEMDALGGGRMPIRQVHAADGPARLESRIKMCPLRFEQEGRMPMFTGTMNL